MKDKFTPNYIESLKKMRSLFLAAIWMDITSEVQQ